MAEKSSTTYSSMPPLVTIKSSEPPSIDSYVLSSFFTLMVIAMVLAIIAFIGHAVFTESTRTAAEHLVRQRQNPNATESEKLFFNVNDTVTFYDRLVRN